MATHLISFGHHPNADKGAIYKNRNEATEVRRLKPYLEKWAKKSKHNFKYYTRDMFADRNIHQHKHFDSITELHMDAPQGNGGHVIIYKGFKPDNIDKRLRDVIKKHFGIVGYLQNSNGFSYRNNLYNINQAAKHGINYRLVEMFFLSNEQDYNHYIRNLDSIAKDIIEAITGETLSGKVNTSKPSKKPVQPSKPSSSKSIEQLANEVIAGKHGTGEARKKALGSNYQAVQNLVNKKLGAKPTSKPTKSIDQLAREVIDGKHGTGEARKKALGNQYNAVQKRVNEILGAKSKPKGKSIDTLAKEVIDGKYGTGEARKRALGSQYQAVQKRVNQILGAGSSNRKSIDTIAREVIDGKWGNDPERSRKLRSAGYDAKAVQRRVNQLL